jgi:hypothetical protein
MAVKARVAGESPQRVRVWGRQDIGEVIEPARVFGHRFNVLCVGVHFPSTGEVAYFDVARVTEVD